MFKFSKVKISYSYKISENDLKHTCNFSGIACLDRTKLMSPQTTSLQDWSNLGINCNCFQSCGESEFKIISQSSMYVSYHYLM